ncbi:MAG: thiamine phosphate synthase [Ignavibacteria bacterium]|nr:thiamine phosphate synthase [Ignavibacteria bacterium]
MNRFPFRLISITDRKLAGRNFLDKIKEISEAGVRCIMIREKDISDRELLQLAKKVKSLIKPFTKLLINDRADIAYLSDSDGVHSPSGGISSELIKKFSDRFIRGRSVHSLKECRAAVRGGFDFMLYGHIFETNSKKDIKPRGLKKLESVCKYSDIPVFAVGGINPSNASNCIKAGAYGIAVISSLMLSRDIKKTVSDFRCALGGML